MLLAAGGEWMKAGKGVGTNGNMNNETLRVKIELDRVRRGHGTSVTEKKQPNTTCCHSSSASPQCPSRYPDPS